MSEELIEIKLQKLREIGIEHAKEESNYPRTWEKNFVS